MARIDASIEITITSKSGGPPLLHQRFETTRELALEFAEKMSAMVAELPGRHAVCKTMGEDGKTVVEIELNKHSPPPVKRPTFEELYSKRGDVNDG